MILSKVQKIFERSVSALMIFKAYSKTDTGSLKVLASSACFLIIETTRNWNACLKSLVAFLASLTGTYLNRILLMGIS